MTNFIYSPPVELVRTLEATLRLGLTGEEFEAAARLVANLAGEDDAPDAAQIVTTVEKAIGLALDESDFEMATAAIQRKLDQYHAEEFLAPDAAPDAYLEMAYEDRISGADQD